MFQAGSLAGGFEGSRGVSDWFARGNIWRPPLRTAHLEELPSFPRSRGRRLNQRRRAVQSPFCARAAVARDYQPGTMSASPMPMPMPMSRQWQAVDLHPLAIHGPRRIRVRRPLSPGIHPARTISQSQSSNGLVQRTNNVRLNILCASHLPTPPLPRISHLANRHCRPGCGPCRRRTIPLDRAPRLPPACPSGNARLGRWPG
jgi:hypothetical protein